MNKNDIITLPHSSLRKRSVRVGLITEDIKKLISNMESATLDWENSREHEVGVALAAVQINKLYRIVIIREDFNDKNNTTFEVFINPEIAKYEGEIEEDFEGCLSVKNVYGKVPRYTKVRVKALNLDGKEVRLKAEGFLARVFQHEIDHTNGKLFVDHIQDKPEAFYKLGETGKIEELENAEKELFFTQIFKD
jgi:peptide deformylase